MLEIKQLNKIEISQGIFALGLGLWISKEKIFIIADLHVGYEEYLNEQGIFVPREQCRLTKNLLELTLKSINPKIVIINGDFKHEFGKISAQEWRDALQVFDLLSEHSEKIILIKGNHDTILGPIAKKRNLSVRDFYFLKKEKIFVTHGHKTFNNDEMKNAKIIIIGNEHPAVSIKEGIKSELFKCFLIGNWKGKKLIVTPSFLPIIEGTDVRKEGLLSPYLQQNLSGFSVLVVGDKIYDFGKLKNIK